MEERVTKVPVVGAVRAYFGPVNRVAGQPMPFDAAVNGRFDLAMPPAGWTSLGWISDFKRVSATKYVPVRAGVQEQVSVQVRTAPDAHVQFQFREWGKLQLAIACGTQHLNLLDVQAAAALQPGSTASALNLDAASLTKFQAGDVVAVDVDYQQQTGYVGTGIPAAFVAGAQAAQLHADYVRRVTYNVAKVASVTQAQLVLDQPLPGGAPAASASVQKVLGFADREGSSYFQEWSGLFIADGAQGDRMCFYYPRLQTMSGTGEAGHALSTEWEQIGLQPVPGAAGGGCGGWGDGVVLPELSAIEQGLGVRG